MNAPVILVCFIAYSGTGSYSPTSGVPRRLTPKRSSVTTVLSLPQRRARWRKVILWAKLPPRLAETRGEQQNGEGEKADPKPQSAVIKRSVSRKDNNAVQLSATALLLPPSRSPLKIVASSAERIVETRWPRLHSMDGTS